MRDKETRLRAKALYGRGWKIVDIAAEVQVSDRTIRQWRDVEGWDVHTTPERALEARLTWLINKADKTDADYGELERLIDAHNRLLRGKLKVAAMASAVPDTAAPEASPETGARARRKPPKGNEVGDTDLAAIEGPPLFEYQRRFIADTARNRIARKARQIGFTTHVMAWDAIQRAIATGYNQIFLSASKRQVQVVNRAIRTMAHKYLGREWKGSKERIDLVRNGKPWAAFIFLSTNTATAQGESGDVWLDEAAWLPRGEEMWKVASAMATLACYRRTVVSTPSTVTHHFWTLWKGRTDVQGRTVDDGWSRHTITVQDAVAGGNDLLDIEQLRQEYGPDQFRQLFECEPLDDEQSLFRLAHLEACQTDPAGWQAVGGAPVWIGYDPSRRRDLATIAVVAKLGTRRRLIEHQSWRDRSFQWQAERILEFAQRYHVERIGIDTTGMGLAVYEALKAIGPQLRVVAIDYTLETKIELVLKVKKAVDQRLFEYEAGDQIVTAAFLAIKQVGTEGGRITYKAGRSADIGHAEVFWAVAHALSFDPLSQRKRMVIA